MMNGATTRSARALSHDRNGHTAGPVNGRGSAALARAGERRLSFSEVAGEKNAMPQNAETAAATKPAVGKQFNLWEKGAFAFGDFVDIVNPLQHVPIVATLYRQFTRDNIGAAPRVLGGALWGRFGGLAGGLINAAVDWFTGKDIGDHVYAAIFGKSDVEAGVAQARAPAASSQPTARASARMQTFPPAQPNTGSIAQQPQPAQTAMLPASSGASRISYWPQENRWEIHDGEDRRVRFTA